MLEYFTQIFGGTFVISLTLQQDAGGDLIYNNLQGGAVTVYDVDGFWSTTFKTGPGDDEVYAKGGDDVVRLGDGADFANLGRGDDFAVGGHGKDIINGGKGNDTINGAAQKDIIRGGDGDDVINGGNGRDRLVGGDGDDELTGGAGVDMFVWKFEQTQDSGDTITDFQNGFDKVVLVGYGAYDFGDIDIVSNFNFDGSYDSVVTLPDGQVIAMDDAGLLGAEDFVFV